MAQFTITECIARIRRLPDKVADRAVEVMKYEIDSSTDGPGIGGHLADTVRKEKYADGTYHVGTHKYTHGAYGIREVGAIIQAGRPELYPRDDHGDPGKHSLRWQAPSGEIVFAKHANAVQYQNNFTERTRDQIEKEIASGQLGL